MIKQLDVIIEHELVGHLIQDQNGQLQFSYTEEWLQNPQAIPISCSLPLQAEPYKQKSCRGYFAGILPEESNREQIARILGISPRNDYAMLEQIGRECAGALSLVPTGEPYPEKNYAYKPLSQSMLVDALHALPKQPLLIGEPGLRLSLAGAQDKMAIFMNKEGEMALPIGGAPSTHIIKPVSPYFPKLAINEAMCLKLAKMIGIQAAHATLGTAGDTDYILVERYDRNSTATSAYPNRIHQEDFCQALGIPSERKYQNEGGPGLKECFELIRQYSSMPAKDIQQLLNTVILNIIIGNHDAHGKNFSLLIKPGKQAPHIQIAPAYDILSTVYYPELTSKMAMKFGKEYKSIRLTKRDFEHFAQVAQLSAPMVLKRTEQLAEQVLEALPSLLAEFPNGEDLGELIQQRAEKMAFITK